MESNVFLSISFILFVGLLSDDMLGRVGYMGWSEYCKLATECFLLKRNDQLGTAPARFTFPSD